MSWTIPPIGWCVTCLVAFEHRRAAAVLWKGNSLCEEHLKLVLADDVAEVIRDARAAMEAEMGAGEEGEEEGEGTG